MLCCIIKSPNPTTQESEVNYTTLREKNQVVLPLDLGICIPDGDFVFKVAEICESLDYTELFNTYLRAWRKVNPITMFEILVFAYMNRKFSSREIESLCKTDIRFMWLLNGEPAPSASTIASTKTTENGYTISTKYYSNNKCGRCPHRDKCHKSKTGYRTIKVNQVILEHRPKALEALTSEEGTLLRMNRSIQVEGVFGVLKEDYGFRRFLTRGKKNIETQFFLLAFALNVEKLCNRTKKGRIGLDLFQLNAS